LEEWFSFGGSWFLEEKEEKMIAGKESRNESVIPFSVAVGFVVVVTPICFNQSSKQCGSWSAALLLSGRAHTKAL